MKSSYDINEFYGGEVVETPASLSDSYSIEEFYKETPAKKGSDFTSPEQVKIRQAEGARKIGLGTRFALEGIAAPVTLGSDLLSAAMGAISGRNIPSAGQGFSQVLTDIGLPLPVTGGERVAGDIATGAIGGAGLAKAGQKAVTGLIGGLSGGAVGATREAGAPLPVQIGAGIAAGVLGSGGIKAASRKLGGDDPLLRDIANNGVDNVAAFDNVRSSIVMNEAKQSKIKSRLFTDAATKGKDAYINKRDINSLASEAANMRNNIFSQKGRDVFDLFSARLQELAKTGGKDINELQVIRRGLVGLSKSADGGERMAAGQSKKLLDDFLQKPGLVKGEVESVSLWNRAIKKTIDNAKKFEEPRAIAKAIGDDTNETVESFFIGSSGAKNKELGNIYKQVVNALPESGKEVGGFRMRQAVVNRMVKNSIRSTDAGTDTVSASNLANQIRLLRTDNKTMWNNFTSREKQALNRLENNLRKELGGGVINKVYQSLESFIRGGIGSNIELPRTLKAKTLVDVDDLQELMSLRAGAPMAKGAIVGINQGVNE